MGTRRAAIYCRLSQDRTGGGVVVERQERDCRELAETLGWDVVHVFVDNDVSAYRKKARPGYTALLAALEAGEADAVLVWHADRLHRSPKELEHYIDVCQPRDVSTVTVRAGTLDLSTAAGRMVARQLGAVARYESEQIAGRTTAGKQDAARRGEWNGGQRIYGYEVVPQADRAPGQSALRVVPVEAEVIRDASRRVLAGESLRSIAKSLNEAGKLTTKGSKWDGSSLRKVLVRPSTAALRASKGEVIGKGDWEPLLPEDEWRGVVALLSDPKRRTNAEARGRKYLGSGLYRCGVCGGPLTGNATAGGGPTVRKAAYRCHSGDRDGQSHVVRDVARLDEFITDVIKARLSRDDANGIATEPAPKTAPLHTEAQALRVRMEEAAGMFAAGSITKAQFLRMNEIIDNRLDEVEKQILAAQKQTVSANLLAGDVSAKWDTMTLDQRRSVIAMLMNVTVKPRHKVGRLPGGAYFDPESVDVEWKAA